MSGTGATDSDEVPLIYRPFSGILGIVGLAVIVACGWGMVKGGGGSLLAAANAHIVSTSSQYPQTTPGTTKTKTPKLTKKTPGKATPRQPVPAPPLDIALRPPPSDGCVDNWCGKQLGYAAIVVDAGRRDAKLPRRAWVVAVATALQETGLKNEANNTYPVTKNLPHDKVGGDHDSVGLFQQRPDQGWGDPAELMNPRVAADKFYAKLAKVVSGWNDWQTDKVRLTDLAQAVQRSGFPDAYQKHEAAAKKIVDYVLRYTYDKPGSTAKNDWFVMVNCANPTDPKCQMVPWQLTQPVVSNKAAFGKYFPQAKYVGDLGDALHMGDDPNDVPSVLEDHTPVADYCLGKTCTGHGWVYAQDLGDGGGFDLGRFVRWLLDQLRAGKYLEVKYVITRIPSNQGVDGGKYFGLFTRDTGWRQDTNVDGHDHHVHISYEPGAENTISTIVADYAKNIGR